MEFNKQQVGELENSITELKSLKSKLSLEKRQFEISISALSNRVRTANRLPDREYKDICRKQHEIKEKILLIESQLIEITNNIRKKTTLKENINNELENINNNDPGIINKIKNLKNKYIEFSGDNTRVASMRLMASQFIEELERIINV